MDTKTQDPVVLPGEQSILRASLEPQLSFIDGILVIARNKWFVLRTTFAIAVIVATVSCLLPPEYQATTTILPPQENDSATGALLRQIGGSAANLLGGKDLGLKSPNDIYVAMLGSSRVADELIDRFGLMQKFKAKHRADAQKALSESSDIVSSKEGLIVIKVIDKDPKLAADLANGYVSVLRQVTSELGTEAATLRRQYFEQQMARVKIDLATSEEGLRQMQETSGFVNPELQAKMAIGSFAEMRAQVAAKEVQLQAMTKFATSQNPEYQLTLQELNALRQQLAIVEAKENRGKGDIGVSTGKISGAALEYARRYREVKYNEMLFDLIARQYEVAKLDQSKASLVIQQLDVAKPPERKIGPRRSLNTLIAALAGCLFAVFFCIGRAAVQLTMTEARKLKFQELREELRFSKG